jgi:hypothetical protein
LEGSLALDDRWIASPLARSRLIAAGVMMFCLLAMIAIVWLAPATNLPGSF